MGEYSEAFIAFDTSKVKHAVAIAEGGRRGEVRFVGDVASSPATVAEAQTTRTRAILRIPAALRKA